MGYIDPKTDGIIVAGGDGTLMEAREKCMICRSKIGTVIKSQTSQSVCTAQENLETDRANGICLVCSSNMYQEHIRTGDLNKSV